MESFVDHIGRIGGLVINKEGTEIIFEKLGTDRKIVIGEKPQITLQVNEIGGGAYSGCGRARYNTPATTSYCMTVRGFTDHQLKGRDNFTVVFSAIPQTEGGFWCSNIIKVMDPGMVRIRGIERTDRGRELAIYDIKKSGNVDFVSSLVNTCVAVFRDNIPTLQVPVRC